MAQVQIPLNLFEMRKFNEKHGTSYNKYHIARALAARNIGFIYDVECDCYTCPTCEQSFFSKEEVKNDHDCDHDDGYDDLRDKYVIRWNTGLFVGPEPTMEDKTEEVKHTPFEEKTTEILFGQFACKVPGDHKLPEVKVEQTVTVDEHIKKCAIQLAIEQYKDIVGEAEVELDLIAMGIKADHPKPMNDTQKPTRNRKMKKEDTNDCLFQTPSVISSISIGGGFSPSSTEYEDYPPKKVHATSRKTPRMKQQRRIEMTTHEMLDFTGKLFNIMAKQEAKFEFIEGGARSKQLCGSIKHVQGVKRLKLTTLHESGIRAQRDIFLTPTQIAFIKGVAEKLAWKAPINADKITYGDSGIVLNPLKMHGRIGLSSKGLFVVRGRCDGELVNAMRRVTHSVAHRTIHYGSIADRWWKAFSETFLYNVPKDKDHVCSSDLSVEDCGTVGAILTQTVFQMGRITCEQCIEQYTNRPKLEIAPHLNREVDSTIRNLEEKFPKFSHVIKFLKSYRDLVNLQNPNIDAFITTQQLIGHRKDAPFSHTNKLNDILIKGNNMTQAELAEASTHVLEIARYLNNRTENMKLNRLDTFRNKISGKTKVDPKLMCDNQLDKNGNFVWGQREYHAKRFLNNYFDEIDPDQGYDKYEKRLGPNGSRQLAIGRLIVSTNEDVLRSQMNGNPITSEPLTQACISKIGDDYVYPCCCVTHESGKPLLSEMKAPTKNHLVIGNTGDSKYVDLPVMREKMYIAKEGYCYVNIFFAMLLKVDEDQAKDFTKTVRDIVILKLGKWPRLSSLAAYCYMLRLLYPSTHDAELPRILVDHKTKTMHVLDSFGSLTTGYHVLKANTISQLITFGQNALDSEMKDYYVGGTSPFKNVERTTTAFLKVLVKGLFKPKLFARILDEEPYIMTLAVISPSILRTLYENDQFDWAMKYLISREMSALNIIGQLKILAKSVSVIDVLHDQFNIIDAHSTVLLEELQKIDRHSMSKKLATYLVETMRDRSIMDEKIMNIGFRVGGLESRIALEQTYVELVQDSWHALTLREKLSTIWRSPKVKRRYIEKSIPKRFQGSPGDLIPSLTILVGTVSTHVKSSVNKTAKSVAQRTTNLCRATASSCLNIIRYLAPDIFVFINTLVVMSLLLSIYTKFKNMIEDYRRAKMFEQREKWYEEEARLDNVYQYVMSQRKDGREPTQGEFEEYLELHYPDLKQRWEDREGERFVKFQSKNPEQQGFERIIAIVSLVMMIFDSERSDCVYRSLMKLRGLTGMISEGVRFQSIDDVRPCFEDKNELIHIELDTQHDDKYELMDKTFREWFSNQITRSNTLPHYRTEGHFMEFTRQTAAEVANKIAHGPHTDVLVRGAVGSGKSTGLPALLSQKGKVLLIEPTRPLTQNVYHQLQGAPFYKNATMRMRGEAHFGCDPITIMTSGFALHFYAHNVPQLLEFDFIIFDECHVFDSSAMAFRCLMKEYSFAGKIIKTSATPPGRECAFTTQHRVDVVQDENLDFDTFITNLGTNAATDITSKCDNILIYVASYNEVDNMATKLLNKGYKVTKVDGRSMKNGRMEITTSGTPQQKHFIVATNIIENGVTLDIDGVVDFGKRVSPALHADMRMITYGVHPISYGERLQRMGRVGRHKPGFVVKAGWTEKGLIEVPEIVATEAAFLCFAYGLPVMTSKVNTSILDACTVRQARTMLCFELSPFYTAHMVRFDGTMHPAIHGVLKKFKLRDSEIPMNTFALPVASSASWYTAREYTRFGSRTSVDADTKIAFLIKDVPDAIHEQIYDALKKHWKDHSPGTIKSFNVAKVAYTLQTDPQSIQRTIKIIDGLIAQEMAKRAHFEVAISNPCTPSFLTLSTIFTSIRSRHAVDHTAENIAKLQAAKGSILEFKNITEQFDYSTLTSDELGFKVKDFGAMDAVRFQSSSEISKFLQLKGHWNKPLIVKDVLILCAVLGGGLWMLYDHFVHKWNEPVKFQGRGKRQNQKLKFRAARDNKMAREVVGDEAAEYMFGAAYNEKKNQKGRTRGLGTKKRAFVNMYGFDPDDFSLIRFVDPVTGYTLDESPHFDMSIVQGDIFKKRVEEHLEGNIETRDLNKGIQAYIMKHLAKDALRVDLTPHNPYRVCDDGTITIAGFPEREKELRQTGDPIIIPAKDVPKAKPANDDDVDFEAKALYRGPRDYNPIASVICQIRNEVGDHSSTIYGLGYGACIITNRHLFRAGSGHLYIRSRHGEFEIKDSSKLKIQSCEGRDMILIQTPRDFPPFPQKLKFRPPISGEHICMVSALFQTQSISSMVSQTSATEPRDDASLFWRHWIDSQDGFCGLPLVSCKDGMVVGIHSLESIKHNHNYYTTMPHNFEKNYLKTTDQEKWTSEWKFNINDICWGSMNIEKDLPTGPFKISKLVSDLSNEPVRHQSYSEGWMYSQLKGNLKAVAFAPSQLVTKHVVKGKCNLFNLYLAQHPTESRYFKPMMGQYQPSALNREAYIKDIMKYSTPIPIGAVDTDIFERAILNAIRKLKEIGFKQCEYVTDSDTIITSMNMKSAVGALYAGKKKDYFEGMTLEQRDEIVRASCFRLFQGKKGIWNGSIKAELRPKEKVLENKTRTFTAAPLDTLLGGKVCVDDFNNQFYSLNITAPWTVGMTKFSLGWDKLLKALPNGWLYCDADGSRFDSSLSPYLINAVLKIRLAFMEQWELGEIMLSNLYAEIIYTPILTADGTIVKKFKGNNSGQPSTVVDNTLMVMLAMMYSLEKLGYKGKQQDDVCRYFANGDDLMIAVHPKHKHILDQLSTSFSDLGLTYDFTSRTKDKGDLWFMSHYGKLTDAGVYIPKLEADRIVSILEWDRSEEPAHRLEAICAAMIEAWGYETLLHEIRKFYSWVLEQAPYSQLAKEGKAPYIAETALKRLYLTAEATDEELLPYIESFKHFNAQYDEEDFVRFQAEDETIDAGKEQDKKKKDKAVDTGSGSQSGNDKQITKKQPADVAKPERDRDINAGSSGTFSIPRVDKIASKMRVPKIKGQPTVNFAHLIGYKPRQKELSNKRATDKQFESWYDGVKNAYEVDDEAMKIIINGLVVWCIENGTSQSLNGSWIMVDGEEQVEYPIKPLLDHAQPTFRQIMTRFSDVAEAYIEMRNSTEPYMPRYGLQRNLTDRALARYAFDFYELDASTPVRAKEAVMQMKAAAVRNSQNKLFGLDGNVGNTGEDTERHTAEDSSRHVHNMNGTRFQFT